MDLEDFSSVYKIIIPLAMNLRTGVDFFYNLPFFDVLNILKEAAELGKK